MTNRKGKLTMHWTRALSNWWHRLQRAELRLVPYSEADALLQQGWRIADEEDSNSVIGIVYLERMEKRG